MDLYEILKDGIISYYIQKSRLKFQNDTKKNPGLSLSRDS